MFASNPIWPARSAVVPQLRGPVTSDAFLSVTVRPSAAAITRSFADAVDLPRPWSAGSAPIDAGSYNVAVATAANDYYEATSYNTDFTIAQRAVTITADGKTSVYSTSPVALSYTYSPIDFYGRDSITVSYSGAPKSVKL